MIELQEYIEHFKDFPLLSAKEERRLLLLIRTPPEGVPKDAESWRLTKEQKEAKDEFISRNIRLVIHTAKKFCKLEDPRMMDFISSGVHGMLHALDVFDISKEVRFSTYAVWWIKAKIRNEIKVHDNKIIRFKTLHQDYKKMRNDYLRENIIRSDEDLFTELNWCSEKIEKFRQDQARLKVSLDTVEKSVTNFVDCDSAVTVEPPQDKILDNLHQKDQIDLMYSALKVLTDEERLIVTKYYGLDGTSMTYDELSEATGIARERTRKAENKALAKMWRFMRLTAPSLCD